MSNAKRHEDGMCGACRTRHHCHACVCCTPERVSLMPARGVTRTYAYAQVTAAHDAHDAHYVRRTATSRIPDGGKVRLMWRDRLTVGAAHVGDITTNPRVPARFRLRAAMLAQAGHAHTL